ncbi:MAG TPA: DUF624 domain-containing protein [Anaerolineae bacterium]|nr:DUF624 domain-containing protein [Anaerolineae bacterium]
MRDALGVFREALRDTYDELFLLVPVNLVTLLLLVPVVTGPPAVAGLWAVGNRVTRGEAVGWRDYFRAFRDHFGRAWALAGLHLAVLGGLAVNLWFYAPGNNPFPLPPQLSLYIQAIWVGMGVLWLLFSQYLLPLILEQEDRRVQVALRNGAVLLAARPGFAVTLLALTILVGVFSTFLTAPWFVITPAFLAVLTNGAVLRLLEPFRET